MALNSNYRLFGLTIASEVEFPELVCNNGGDPDIWVRRGPVPGGGTVEIRDIARFDVRGGSEIIVDEASDADPRNVRLYLLGSALGLLLHQRGLLPLHANAVEVSGGVIGVMGAPGAGKSTLAAWLMGHGCRLLSDDVCVVRFDAGEPIAFPGPPRLRLWGASLDALGYGRAGAQLAYAGADDWDKWDVPIDAASLASCGLPLGGLYLLRDADDLRIAPLTGAGALEALSTNTYRGDYLTESTALESHWRACLRLAATVPVFELQRPRDLTRLDALGEALLAHHRSAAGARTSASVR